MNTEITPIEPQAVPLKWFAFNQNNSGGYWITDEQVAPWVFIQARSAKEAIQKAKSLFEDKSDFCECCGERWSYYVEDDDGHSEPTMYDEPLFTYAPQWGGNETRLHYFDGSIEKFTIGAERAERIGS